jgi:putative transposase
MIMSRRREFVDTSHRDLSLTRQCKLLHISRAGLYYKPKGESALNLSLMEKIDRQHLKTPWYGARQMARFLRRHGYCVSRKRISRLMRKMGVVALAPGPQTSKRNKAHAVYPYLLRDLKITNANQVWCTDVTFIPMQHGFLYLVAIMDWHTRHVLSWRLSTTQDTNMCLEALEEAVENYGVPQIFNTDQGSQFTSTAWIEALKSKDIKISMDGKGCWVDNVFIERLWRSLKYECIYINAFDTFKEAWAGINHWMNYYNDERPHSSLNDKTPSEVYLKMAA